MLRRPSSSYSFWVCNVNIYFLLIALSVFFLLLEFVYGAFICMYCSSLKFCNFCIFYFLYYKTHKSSQQVNKSLQEGYNKFTWNVLQVYNKCTAGVQQVYNKCTTSLQNMYNKCTKVYKKCKTGEQQVYNQCKKIYQQGHKKLTPCVPQVPNMCTTSGQQVYKNST